MNIIDTLEKRREVSFESILERNQKEKNKLQREKESMQRKRRVAELNRQKEYFKASTINLAQIACTYNARNLIGEVFVKAKYHPSGYDELCLTSNGFRHKEYVYMTETHTELIVSESVSLPGIYAMTRLFSITHEDVSVLYNKLGIKNKNFG